MCTFFSIQVLSPQARTNLVTNIAGHLKDAQEFIQKRAVRNFSCADPEYGRRIQELLNQHKIKVKQPCVKTVATTQMFCFPFIS